MADHQTLLSEGALARAWRAGDQEALRTLVDRHRAAAFGLAYHLCGSLPEADALTQAAFRGVLARFTKDEPLSPFRGKLYRAIAQLYLGGLRRRRPATSVPPYPLEMPTDRALQTGLDALSPEPRAMLVLYEIGGFSYAELSQRFDLSPQAVRTRLAQARADLHDALTPVAAPPAAPAPVVEAPDASVPAAEEVAP